MIIIDFDLSKDGVIDIVTERGVQYKCNPGVWGTKACIGYTSGGKNKYSYPELPTDELVKLKIAISNFMPTKPYQVNLRDQILGVMNIEYGISI